MPKAPNQIADMESKSKSISNLIYDKGEHVLCYHVNKLYMAKVIDLRDDPNEHKNYRIHYQGWNKNWDDWVGTDRLLKQTPQNLELKKKLDETPIAKPEAPRKSKGGTKKRDSQVGIAGDDNSSTASAPSTPATPAPSSNNAKENHQHPHHLHHHNRQQPNIEPPPDVVQLRPEAKIKIPEELKAWLTDDQNAVKDKQLSVIPAAYTISVIFDDYIQYKKSSKLAHDRVLIIEELIRGLKGYFNVLLGLHLLYKFERPQYQALLEEHGNDTDLTNFYGVIHLVRMFPQFSRWLSLANLDEKSITSIVTSIHDIMRWLSKSSSYYDVDEYYQVAPPEYLK